MSKVTMCGIDAHDKTLVCMTVVGKDEEIGIWRVPNTQMGRRSLFRRLGDVAKEHGSEKIVIAYEASGLGYGLYDEAMNEGIRCYVLAPTKIRKRDDERRKKNDERDAKMILETIKGYELAGNELPEVWVPDLELRQHRDLVRACLEVGEKLSEVKNQILSFLKRNGIKKPEKAGNVWTLNHQKWLEGLRLPKELDSVFQSLIRRLYFYMEEQKDLHKAVEELSRTARYAKAAKALKTLNGVGVITAMVFLTQMGDLNRFNNRRQVGAYPGLAPGSSESGDDTEKKGRITRDGPTYLRKVLCQAAWVAIRTEGSLRDFYLRIVERNPKKRKKAIVAVMRKLSIIMWHVAKDAIAEAA